MQASHLLLTGAVLAAGIVGGFALYRLQAERRRLRQRITAAAAELQHLQTSFARFAPNAVVEGLALRRRPSEASRREVTVLFADLVGFTALMEALDPEVLVAVLNGYFVRMSRAIGE